MKRCVLPLVLFAAIVSGSIGLSACKTTPDTNRDAARTANANAAKETVDPVAIEAELLRLEREWNAVAMNHDAEAVRRIVADDALIIYPDGTIGTKSDEVRDAEAKASSADAWDLMDPKITVLGADGAVVTGRTSVKNGKYKGPDGKIVDTSGEYRFTDVFARRNGKWQVVTSQATKIFSPVATSPAPRSSPVAPPPSAAKSSPSASAGSTP